MPKAHQRYANMTPASLIGKAGRIGANAAILVERLMLSRPHPEQGYRSAMGVLSLALFGMRPRGCVLPMPASKTSTLPRRGGSTDALSSPSPKVMAQGL